MARPVRVDALAFADPRIDYLAQLAGYDRYAALGRLIYLWSYCTDHETYVAPTAIVELLIGAPADCLVRVGLAEQTPDGLRIRGTSGRTDWPARRRATALAGGMANKARIELNASVQLAERELDASVQLAEGERDASRTLADASASPIPIPIPSISQTPVVPTGDVSNFPISAKRGRPKKPKPSDPTEAELASVRIVLAKLSARSGVKYTGSKAHTTLIVARLRDGYSEMDLRRIVAYCADQWADDPKIAAYLRPETLFGPTTIERYADAARTAFPEEVAQ